MGNIVYHYCSTETFLNILKNNTIRMTDLNKMNDYSEMKATLDFLEEELNNILYNQLWNCQPIIAGCANETAIEIIVERLIYKIRMCSDRIIFATCFSKNRDLLSQWCKYANNGRGVAIGFDMEWFTQLVDYGNAKQQDDDEKQFKIGSVTYVKCKEDLCNELYETAEMIAGSIIDAINLNETEYLLNSSEILGGFLNLERVVLLQKSAFYKIKDFSEEQEIRIIFDDDLEKSGDNWEYFFKWDSNSKSCQAKKLFPDGLQFRATDNDIISYLDMRFDVNCNEIDDCQVYTEDKSGIIREVVLGSDCKLIKSDITQLLLAHGYLDAFEIPIERSHATYRK